MRGGMDASQYKDHVLALLFIKYISDKYAGQLYAPIVIPTGGLCAVGRRGQQLSVRYLCRCHKKAPVRCVGILLPPT